jgi:RNA polymerase sigma factor (sigma-70 family)
MSEPRENCAWSAEEYEMHAISYLGLIKRSILRVAWRYTVFLQPADVEDLVQETLLALWRRGPQIRPESTSGYIAQAARNLTVDSLRRRGAKKRGDRKTAPLESVPEPSSYAATPEAQLIASDALQFELERCRRILTERSFEILRLVYVDGLSSGEVAGRLACSQSTVDSALHRAKRRLLARGIRLRSRNRD